MKIPTIGCRRLLMLEFPDRTFEFVNSYFNSDAEICGICGTRYVRGVVKYKDVIIYKEMDALEYLKLIFQHVVNDKNEIAILMNNDPVAIFSIDGILKYTDYEYIYHVIPFIFDNTSAIPNLYKEYANDTFECHTIENGVEYIYFRGERYKRAIR